MMGVLQNTLQHPLTILPQAKWSPAGVFYSLAPSTFIVKRVPGHPFYAFSDKSDCILY
jgi:hypothetical protein